MPKVLPPFFGWYLLPLNDVRSANFGILPRRYPDQRTSEAPRIPDIDCLAIVSSRLCARKSFRHDVVFAFGRYGRT
jgi:hypothetical protein